jgi:hypothetical protein
MCDGTAVLCYASTAASVTNRARRGDGEGMKESIPHSTQGSPEFGSPPAPAGTDSSLVLLRIDNRSRYARGAAATHGAGTRHESPRRLAVS